jgi:hypothetical protein
VQSQRNARKLKFSKRGRRLPFDKEARMLRSEIDFPPIPQIGELDEDFKARQKLEIDRWRAAITIIQRMREAGISCELSIDLKNGH